MYLDEMTESETHSIQVNYNLSGTPCLNVKLIKDKNKFEPSYSILNYNKELLSYHNENILLYRSVVYSYPELDLLSFSPPKMDLPSNFFSRENYGVCPRYYVNEYIDGLMIHLFYDGRLKKWKMTTQNDLVFTYDGTKQHSLSSIICSILKYSFIQDVSQLPFWDNLSKDHCYNFTLTNKHSHIHHERRLYLTSVYKIHKKNVMPISPELYETWRMFDVLRGLIYFPENYTRVFQETSYLPDDIKTRNISGMVVMNTNTGNRCKYVSQSYNIYKKLRHIEHYYLYIFICYVKMNQHNKILPFIYKTMYNMKKIHSIWKSFVKYLHQTYLDYYVFKKEMYLQDHIRSYLQDIHQQYYINKKNMNTCPRVKKEDIVQFLIKKHPQDVFHVLKNI
jgi:hypothetical protein